MSMPSRPFTFRCSALLFDLDGVLVDSRACVEAVWERWAEEHQFDAKTIIHAAHGRRTSEALRQLFPHLDIAAEVAALEDLERVETRGIFPVPHSAEILSTIPRNRWAIVTSGSIPVATLRMRVAGVPMPEVFITAEDVSEGKPSPAGYLLAAHRLGTPAADCVVIEDAPAGIAAAKNAGMRVIGVAGNYPASALAADAVVPALGALSVRVESNGALIVTGTEDGDLDLTT
jgi:sugar-phosphatase